VPARDRYHHGSLREELISACLALIAAEGIAAVSLRRVAREAGVSPGAPYHHFADRAALLAAISTQGFMLLAARLEDARASATGPADALGALLGAYVGFAREQPAYFTLMFRPELSKPEKHPEAQAAGESALGVLIEVVADCQRAGVAAAGDAAALAAMAWALGTGLASLWSEGQLDDRKLAPDASADELAARVTALWERMLG
jgi:AcrR family transcriptional regulator